MKVTAFDTLRVLITGGCGFIGHHFVRAFLAKGYDVTVLDDLSTGSIKNLPNHRSLTFIQASVLDEQAVRWATTNVHLIVHLASLVGMRLCHHYSDIALNVSVKGTSNLLKYARDMLLILFSSSAVYGVDSADQTEEKLIPSEAIPLSYDGGKRGYAVGKWTMEHLAMAACDRGSQVIIIRPFNVVGGGQRGCYGMVIPTFIENALQGKPLYVYGDGTQTRCFSDVHMFVNCVLKLLKIDRAWEPPYNIINIGSDQSTSIHTLARLVHKMTNSTGQICFKSYDEVFPGKRDVQNRVQHGKNLERLIGDVEWPDTSTIVSRILTTRTSPSVNHKER